jgi:hypothetical protein
MKLSTTLVGLPMAFSTLTGAAPVESPVNSTTVAAPVEGCVNCPPECYENFWIVCTARGFAVKVFKGKGFSTAVPVAIPTGGDWFLGRFFDLEWDKE